jgi:hypothetical protein
MSGPSDPHAALKGCIRFCPSRFLENRIEFGVHLSSLAATKLDAGNPASAERSMDSAEKA